MRLESSSWRLDPFPWDSTLIVDFDYTGDWDRLLLSFFRQPTNVDSDTNTTTSSALVETEARNVLDDIVDRHIE